jgi:hypothetical protein
MRKALKKLRDLVAELKSISAGAVKESDRLIAKLDHEISHKVDAAKARPKKKKKKKTAPRKAR